MFIKFVAFKMHEQKQNSEQVWSEKKKSSMMSSII